jgi:indolepyruvate ferredoxin oxidoreductase
MAAHLEGRRVIGLDQTGLAQKFGAVLSHVRVADRQEDLRTAQIPAGAADLLLGIDLTVASGAEAIGRLDPHRTYVVVNTHEELPPAVIFNRDLEIAGGAMLAALAQASRVESLFAIDASRLSTALTGDSIAANLFLLGSACQQGLLPASPGALERAIELNGVAVNENKRAFEWGRHAVAHPTLVRELSGESSRQGPEEGSLAGIIEHRASFLTAYQSRSYARRYRDWVERVRAAEAGACPGSTVLTEAVARNYFKLLAYKDEYEIARLYVQTDFIADTLRKFDGRPKLKFHLSPPWLARADPLSGRPAKYELGSWVLPVFALLARLRFLRGTVFDVFAHSAERRAERQLLTCYESLLSKIVNEIDESRLDLALELARLPDEIRGFGPVKKAAIACAQAREVELLGVWSCAGPEAVSQHSSAA